jgi:hypothetical protein
MRITINYETHFFLLKGERGFFLYVDWQKVGAKLTLEFHTADNRKIFQIKGDPNPRYFDEDLDEHDVANIIRFIMYNNTIPELNNIEFYCDDFGAEFILRNLNTSTNIRQHLKKQLGIHE